MINGKNRLVRTAVAFVLALIPSLMVVGLIIPFVGPAIDHHYVDRSPGHMHIFIGQVTNDHTHSLVNHDHTNRLNEDGVSIATSSAISVYGQLTLDGSILDSSFNYFEHDFPGFASHPLQPRRHPPPLSRARRAGRSESPQRNQHCL